MEVPEGWASDESTEDAGFSFFPEDAEETALSELELTRAAGFADSLHGVTQVEVAFDGFQVVHPDAFRSCSSLTHLGLMHNGLTQFPRLHHVASTLTKLELSHQKLDSMAGLQNAGQMPNLRDLALNNNQITRIEALESCPNLTRLWLFSNKLTKIENLEAMVRLKQLLVQDNRLAFDETKQKNNYGFEPLIGVKEIGLAGNPGLDDLDSCIAACSVLPTLTTLSFQDRHFAASPVVLHPEYRESVIENLKALVTLDDITVSVLERGAAVDDRVRRALESDPAVEQLRSEHTQKIEALEEKRDRSLAAARGANARATAKLRALEKALRHGREVVRAEADKAAARREERRQELRETLLKIGEQHAIVSNAIITRGESHVHMETERFEEHKRRLEFERDAASAYEELSSSSSRTENATRGVFELDASDSAFQEMRECIVHVATAAGEPVPTMTGDDMKGSERDDNDNGGMFIMSARRAVDADALSAFERVSVSGLGDGLSDISEDVGDLSQIRWGFIGLAPDATRRALKEGLEIVSGSVKAHRSLQGAWDASKLALTSSVTSINSEPDRGDPSFNTLERASLLKGPAAVLMCRVRLTREETKLWDMQKTSRSALKIKIPVFVDVQTQFILSRVCVQYVLHCERDIASTSRAGIHSVLRSTRRDVPDWFGPSDASALRDLESEACAAVRRYRYDAWTACDPETGADLLAQDDELETLRMQLDETKKLIAAERETQDDISRSLRKVTFKVA
tara:strand:+ start:21090 stop:23330 length:2241 start_codon:yes stop_codon:yes gene_type:complete